MIIILCFIEIKIERKKNYALLLINIENLKQN